jgi:hypothetical protein
VGSARDWSNVLSMQGARKLRLTTGHDECGRYELAGQAVGVP